MPIPGSSEPVILADELIGGKLADFDALDTVFKRDLHCDLPLVVASLNALYVSEA
jgi:hypothetical protein